MASYKITIASDATSWMSAYMPALVGGLTAAGHHVKWVCEADAIPEGELLFCLSFTRLLTPEVLTRNKHNLVVHQSALPAGRGWSPLSWQIIEGAQVVPVCLFEAAPEVDSGLVYYRDELVFAGTELIDELRKAQAEMSVKLCLRFVQEYPDVIARGVPQSGVPSYYPRRGPEASRLDPDSTLREQFNLLRIADNDRYPAYFELGGERYVLRIEKQPRASASEPGDWLQKRVPARGSASADEPPGTAVEAPGPGFL